MFKGRAAVTLFFVLSGFVLGLSLQRAVGSFAGSAGTFWFRRVLRIYPVVLASTAALFVLQYLAPIATTAPWASAWLREVMPAPTNPWLGNLAMNLLLLRNDINAVSWTLQVELIGSFFLPLLDLVQRLGGWFTTIPIFVCLLIVAAFSTPPDHPWFYLFLFWMGYALCRIPEQVARIWTRSVPALSLTLVSIALLLLSRLLHNPVFLSHAIEGVGATLLLCSVLWTARPGMFRLLDFPAVRFLGRISYSFYLVHFFVLLGISSVLLPHLLGESQRANPLLVGTALAFTTIALAVPMSWASFVAVESPLNSLGRRLTMRWKSEIRT